MTVGSNPEAGTRNAGGLSLSCRIVQLARSTSDMNAISGKSALNGATTTFVYEIVLSLHAAVVLSAPLFIYSQESVPL